MDESIKIALLNSLGSDRAMEKLLRSMVERTRAEFCGFYTARERELMYLMLESRELSPRISEVREKLMRVYRMFANEPGPDIEPLERLFFKRQGGNVAYLLGNARIESYFLVPVSFDSKVRGVLYFGSVRREAFGRNEIAEFRSLADEGDERTPLIFRVGGEMEIFEKMLDALPQGAALVSRDGTIVCANAVFGDVLQVNGSVPETLSELGKASPFNVQGVWEEFKLLKRNLIDRELAGVCVPVRFLAVTWVRLDHVSEDVDSLVLLRDVTARREQVEAREELVAAVAHELRTPLTALKNSLAILASHHAASTAERGPDFSAGTNQGSASFTPGTPPERFFKNALRTVDRLGRLVDSLIDASATRADERPITLEPVTARQFLEDASILFVEPMRVKEIVFTISVARGASRIIVDRDRLEQVIQNLLANSIKHVPSGGALSLSVEPCRGCPSSILPSGVLRYVPEVRFIDLCVRDTGIGIPPEITDRINPDAGFSGRPVRASRGLGLYLARRLVRMHGGSLSIEGSIEEGSEVHLYLPADEATSRIVSRYRSAEESIEEMLARGMAPTVYCIEKTSPASWEEALGAEPSSAAGDAERGEITLRSIRLWALSESFGVAVGAEAEPGGPPGETLRCAVGTGAEDRVQGDGIRYGCAVGPREGLHMRELLAAAERRMGAEADSISRKGERE
jgi:signal transduction histidine kinase